jgi:site-specific DNA recombinase
MDGYFAYIRVSTVKQGERGTSLDEQRSAIEAYASRNSLSIVGWYEEMETAAKQGRRQFTRMLAELQKGKAKGVVIHKIDRSARNLKDWAQLGDLIDAGVDVRFAHESIDLTSRGGRLSADIQAVVAADFIRNHKQVVRSGFEGRLKQGLYPLPAPRGYLDQGKGKPKTIDPVAGPLVRQAFELYASGGHSFDTLRAEMAARGLRGKSGKPLSLDAVSVMLRRPFYIGLICIERTGQTFDGVHEPLVSKAVFDRVQAIISGRVFARPQKHAHTYRRMIRCAACGYALIAELQKGRTYYRCHTKTCHGTTLHEDDIDRAIQDCLAGFAFTDDEFGDIRDLARELQGDEVHARDESLSVLHRDMGKCEDRLTRLTDAFLDGLIDKETFETRKGLLLVERRSLRDALEAPQEEPFGERVLKILERGKTAYLGYDLALPEEKREIVRELTSNLRARGKNLEITMQNDFQTFVEWRNSH